jgi:hypothetical protein
MKKKIAFAAAIGLLVATAVSVVAEVEDLEVGVRVRDRSADSRDDVVDERVVPP